MNRFKENRAAVDKILEKQAEILNKLDKISEIQNGSAWQLNSLYDGMIKTMPRKTIKFCFDIVEKCNLNCIGCLTFSPCLREKKGYIMSRESFEKDLKLLKKLFREEEIQVITLGGRAIIAS